MIDLSLYPKIERDIQSRNTSLIPLIVIDEEHDPIYISTQKGLFDGDKFFEDIGLKINSIKESIDIENKKFKINNLSFELNNYPKNNKRMSDFVLEMGLVNKYINIYYKTQSCSVLDDCILLYRGTIRRLDHDSTKIKFQLEDLTQDKLSKEVPISSITNYEEAYSKDYINRPIPITYGKVSRAPAVPIMNKTSADDPVNIRIVCDDVFNADRDIEMAGFGGDEENLYTSSFISQGYRNPLYIYKGDYYQVLESFNPDVLGEDEEDWNWDIDDQYSILNNNAIEITKHFSGSMPLNPPAFNELQCVKIRFPTECLVSGNPEGDSIPDDNGISIIHLQESIKSPQLAIDNPFEMALSNNQTELLDDYEPFDTVAKIPDNTIDLATEDELIKLDFRVHDNEGFWMPSESNATYQHRIFEWLNINMHNLNNDLESPRVVYKQLPTIKLIKLRLNHMLHNILMDYDDSFWFFNEYYSNLNYIDVIGGNAYHSQYPATYHNAFHSTSTTYNDSTYEGAHGADSNYQFWGHNYQATHSPNQQWWYELNDNSPVPQPVFFKFRVKSDYRVYLHQYSNITRTTFDYIFVSMNNGSFNISDLESEVVGSGVSAGGSKYYNIFDMEDEIPFIFGGEGSSAIDDFPEYTPFQVSQKKYHNVNELTYFIGYDCVWNGVSETAHDAWAGANGFSSQGYWGSYGLDHEYSRVNIDGMFEDKNDNWVIWIKGETIPSVGFQYDDQEIDPFTSGQDGNTANGINNQLSLTTGTMFPTIHRRKVHPSWDWSIVFVNYFGNIQNSNPTNFEIFDYDAADDVSERRLSLVFPLADLDVEDDIKTDTYFYGKIKCFFDANGTTDLGNAYFQLNVGAVDTLELIEGEQVLDFDNIDDSGENMINKQLGGIVPDDLEQWWSPLSSDYPYNEEGELILIGNNNYAINPLIKVNQFWQINNFNAFTLNYKIDNNNIGSEGSNPTAGAQALMRTHIHSAGLIHFIHFEKAFDSPFYIDSLGRTNSQDDVIINEEGLQVFKYTGEEFNQDTVTRIDNPVDIMYHFLEKELGFEDIVNTENINEIRALSSGDKLAFSVKEKVEAKKLISELSKSTRMFPRFKSVSEFEFVYIKDTYIGGDEDMTIDTKDIIKYSFTRTPIEKVKTIVNVKYKIDYENDEFTRSTGYIDGYDTFGNGDGNNLFEGRENGYSYEYLGLEREDNVLEFESEYIRDRQSAKALRDFLYMWNCNQHNQFKITLPIKYLMLEAGDIINFNSLIDEMKAYGEDYTQAITRNGQNILPFFIINKIDKKPNQINIQCTQLHSLIRTFSAVTGSISRLENQEFTYISEEDYFQLESFLLGGEQYFTQEQKRVADIGGDGIIGEDDLLLLSEMAIVVGQGDINWDGEVDISDVVTLVNQIVSGQPFTEEMLAIADMNNDGIINIIDIIAMVNQILGE